MARAPYVTSYVALRDHSHKMLFIYLFILLYLESRMTLGVGRDRNIFYPPVHSPNDHSNWGWARMKAGARNSILNSHVGIRAQILGPSSASSLGTLAGRCIRNGALGTCSTAAGSSTYCTRMPEC